MKEQIIQIDGDKVLTSKGRMFGREWDLFEDTEIKLNTWHWLEIEPPVFEEKV